MAGVAIASHRLDLKLYQAAALTLRQPQHARVRLVERVCGKKREQEREKESKARKREEESERGGGRIE